MAATKFYALRRIKKAGGGHWERGDVVDISDWPNPDPWINNGMISRDDPTPESKPRARKKPEKTETPETETPEAAPEALPAPEASAVGTECGYCSRTHRSEQAAANCAERARTAAAAS